MEIRLRRGSEGAQWNCSVFVLFQNNPEIRHFDSTTDLAKVELLLQRARLATFNPSNFESYRLDVSDPPLPSSAEPQHSDNEILVKITGANVDVTLIDLPGLMVHFLEISS
jgi:hypothetical protein